MNVETINAAAVNLYGGYSAKKSDGNAPKFSIPQIDVQAESTAIQNSSADAVSAMEAMTGKAAVTEPSYSVTDEEAEYFREKYGDTYDEEKAGELYYELADKGIISENDAGNASGIGAVRLVDLSNVPYLGLGNCDLVSLINSGALKVRAGERQFMRGIAFTDKHAYKAEYDSFNAGYDREVVTWGDALQKQTDFLDYFRELSLKNSDISEKKYPGGSSFDMWLESLKKTKSVISRIWG